MQLSLEVRWFLQGTLPEELSQWFEQDKKGEINQEDREDWYLRLPQQQGVGIKLREGNLEIKQQLDDRGVQKFAKGIKGRIEKWLKWSFTLSDTDEEQTHLSTADAWIAVKKIRRSKTYQVLTNGAVEAIDATKAIDQGCQVELAELSVLNQAWYSLGFEAFGTEDKLEKTLQRVLEEVLVPSEFLSLKARYSYGYPKWLDKMQSGNFS